MWLNTTHRSSAVHPSSICLQKGLITMGCPCLLLLETPCSNDFRALQESAAEKCLLHTLCGYRDAWNIIKSSRGCCFWRENWWQSRSPKGKDGAEGYEDGGVTCPQFPLCKQWLLWLAAAAALPASAAGKAGSSYKILRPFHDRTLWETPPGTHLSSLQLTPGKGRHCFPALCREGKRPSSASPPLSGTFLTKQLQEAGHDHDLESCCAFANVTKTFDTTINYK